MAWLDHEEAMFRRLERTVVATRLQEGFTAAGFADVDGFLSFSLSVQNRRKSRMGHAFEHHLAAVFNAFGIHHTRQGRTEHGNTADFLFPGSGHYHDHTFDAGRLTMLAAKSTCKERWRQVLPEAERIDPKHLATLEPGITNAQIGQMRDSRLQLVVPSPIHITYSSHQRAWLWTISQFIHLVSNRQN